MGQVIWKNTNMNRECNFLLTIFPLYCDGWAFACVQLTWPCLVTNCHASCTRAKTQPSQYKGKIVSRKLHSLFIFVFFHITWPIYTYFTVWLLPYYTYYKFYWRQNTYPSSLGDTERSIYDLLAPPSTRHTRYIKWNIIIIVIIIIIRSLCLAANNTICD